MMHGDEYRMRSGRGRTGLGIHDGNNIQGESYDLDERSLIADLTMTASKKEIMSNNT
jgi:hypothetical protein